MKDKLYVTPSIPYVNAEPHVGFALELVQADVLARYARLIGREVRFQTGTDENAFKNVLAAESRGVPTQAFVDANAGRFRDLVAALHVSADDFIRTTEVRHRDGVAAFWRALRAGDIVERDYVGRYCTGCEDFYLERDLVDGHCPEHGTPAIALTERNYFFCLSQYQSEVAEDLAADHPAVLPATRRREVQAFVEQGLADFSISRAAIRTRGWGTAVPGDEDQRVYVWIDALVNYLSAIGYGGDKCSDDWRQWWGEDVEKIHVIGKNVWKFHAVYWPALLRSAGLPRPDRVLVHGFVTVDGQKIGKSAGNAVDPFALIDRFGVDALRYYLLRAIPTFGDGDFSIERLAELYRTDLSNGLGNLVSRLAALGEKAGVVSTWPDDLPPPPDGFAAAIAAFELDRAIALLWDAITAINQDIERHRPWELAGDDPALRERLRGWLDGVAAITAWLTPFLPATAEGIRARLFAGPVRKATPLFPRGVTPLSE